MRSGRTRHWWLWLGLWTAVGLGIRLATVYANPGKVAAGDPYFYFTGAKLLVSGHGFINPFNFVGLAHTRRQVIQSAQFPPLWEILEAFLPVVGIKSFLAERVWASIVGSAAIVVCGLAGREIGGRRVGLLTAFLIAVAPNIWMSDQLALSETISPLLVGGVVLVSYRFWKEPTLRRAVWVGAVLGIAMLGRDELTVLVVLLVVPLMLLTRSLQWRQRLSNLAVGLLAIGLVVGPWVGYNLSRFEKPVFITTGLGVTLASADCPTTYSGRLEGYWSEACAIHYQHQARILPGSEESVTDARFEKVTLHFVRTHEDRLLPVSAAKLGRGFGFFRPIQQIHFDALLETRPFHWALFGLYLYYSLFALAIGGAVVLRHRRVPVFPFVAVGLQVAFSMVLTFGDTRYRTNFDVVLAMLAAVQLEWIWARLRPAHATEIARPPVLSTLTQSSGGVPVAAG